MSSSVWSRALLSATAAAVLAAPTITPTVARAGEYHVNACRLPDGTQAPVDGWRIAKDVRLSPLEQSSPPEVGVSDPAWQGWVSSCAIGGSFGASLNDQTTQTTGGPRFAVLRFEPGAGLTITRGLFWRAFSSYGSGRAALQYPAPTGSVDALLQGPRQLDGVSGNTSLGNSGVPAWPSNRFEFPIADGKGKFTPDAPASYLDLVVSCSGAAPCAGASAQIFRSDLVLNDPTGPAVDLAGGTVLEPGGLTSRILKGNESVTVAASDSGAGVERLAVEIDGQAFASSTFRGGGGVSCRWERQASDGLPSATAVRPCPPTGSATVAIDTTRITDGAHQLRVVAADGSGASTTVAEGRILVRNTDAVGPGSPDEFRGARNGSVATDLGQLTAGWTATAKAPSKSKTVQRRCKRASYVKRNQVKCNGRPASAKVARAWSKSKADQLGGRLVDPAGNPIAGATLDVWTTPGETPKRVLGTTTTNENGEFRTTVQRSAGSQQIQVVWRARTGDSVPGATTDLELKVKAGSTFAASNTRAGRTVKFKGRIVAGDLVKSGGSVRLQYVINGGWSNFDTATIDENGRWMIERKLKSRARYKMRVIVDDSPRAMFAGSTGNAKIVRIN